VHGVVYEQYDADALLAKEGLAPGALATGSAYADVRLSQGDGFKVAVLTNYDPLEKPLSGVTLRLPGEKLTGATAYATDLPEEGEALRVEGDTVFLPTLRWGGIVIIV
jgi:hypothetical protein